MSHPTQTGIQRKIILLLFKDHLHRFSPPAHPSKHIWSNVLEDFLKQVEDVVEEEYTNITGQPLNPTYYDFTNLLFPPPQTNAPSSKNGVTTNPNLPKTI
jgi:hypothetical protein